DSSNVQGSNAMKRIAMLAITLCLLASTAVFAAGKVTEAKTGKGVAERKITDETSTFAPGDRAYLWMKIEGASGENLTVTWQVNGRAYPTSLKVGGDPWRTWASKTLHIAGEWTVTVTDASGATLHEAKLAVK